MTSKLGDLLFADDGSRYPQMKAARTDPQMAAARTLAAYVLRQAFVIGAGEDGKETVFNLKGVLHKWPRNADLEYPCASITTPTSTVDPHVPFPLTSTWNRYAPGSVLWRTGELVANFQLDFWVNDEPTQEAIAAALPGIFNPQEGASGVMLRGPDTYWCLPVRCTLVGNPERAGDTEDGVYTGERRLLARVRAELDVVHLREVKALRRVVDRTDVLDPKA